MNKIKRINMLWLALCAVALTAVGQVPGSALDHMLQRPRVSKTYKDKTLFDHLFVDAGLGISAMGPGGITTNGLGELNIGDWFTPEHGMRLHFDGGIFKPDGLRTKYVGGGLDYLLNLTALSQYGNDYQPRTFELYGIAGLGYHYSRQEGISARGLDVHIGLRGQAALSPFTYLYIEPRVAIMDDDVAQGATWHGYRPVASLSAGLGYRLPQHRLSYTEDKGHVGWADNIFIGVMGGPTALLSSDPSNWSDYGGLRLAGTLGKWFGHTNGLRLNVNGSYFDQKYHNKVKAIGAGLDYMLNMHNAFGGYNPDRRFWVNALAGVSYNYTSVYSGIHGHAFGYGGGLQANVRLSRDVDFVVEPRVDFYGNSYAPYVNSFNQRDVMGSVLAGLVYTYHDRRALRDDDTFTQQAWHDHMFVETGIGLNLPVMASSLKHPGDYLRPSLYVAVGKWFSPLHGMRLWGQLAQTQYDVNDRNRYKHVSAGADYLLNLTNALYGYRADRKFDVVGGLGANVLRREGKTSLFMGLDASLRATWRPNRLMGFFIEPRLQGYGDNLLPSTLSFAKLDLIAGIQAGVQFNLDMPDSYKKADGDNRRTSIMIAGGVTNHLGDLRTARAYSPIGRLSYTHWYSNTSAWRANLQGYIQRAIHNSRLGQVGLGLDWMTDFTAQTYGYDPDRVLSFNGFVGANAGVDFGDGRTCFAPDVHVGTQMSLRVSDAVRVVVEPQLSYQMSSRWNSQSQRVMPQLLLGLDYSMNRHQGKRDNHGAPAHSNVVMAGLGVGTYSGSFREVSPYRNKFTFNADLGYGRWLDQTNGAYVRLSHLTAQRRGEHNQSIHSLQAGYMLNVKSAITGESTESDVFQLTTLLGASMNVATRSGHGPTYAPGLQAAVQAGVRVAPQVEIYLEPSVAAFGKTIERSHNSYPVEAMAKLSLGTKISF